MFAAHATLRAAITPARRGAGSRKGTALAEPPSPRHIALSRAQRRKRVFGIEIERCARCAGRLRVIARIEAPALIERILAHRRARGVEGPPRASRGARAPPQGSLF